MSEPLITFHPYQQKWLRDDRRFKIGMFARQTGKTFTTSAEIVDDCLSAEIAGGRARWVILSRGERQAKEAMEEAVKPFCKAFYHLYQALKKAPEFSESDFRGESGAVYKALEVTFPGGSRITALPANPDTARGFSANVYLDEFAFHHDSRKIWSALFPVISKPGLKLRVTSTPNGKGNKFYELWTAQDSSWSKHRVDIETAVNQGLARDIAELRAGAGDEDLWRQEYLLEFLDEASAWLTYDLIMSCENEAAGDPSGYQGAPCYIGNDIARRGDLWVAWVWEEVGDVLWTREIVTLKNKTFAEQDSVLDALIKKYRVARLAMDQTGMGEKPVEDAKRRYGGGLVEGVIMTAGRKLAVATAARQRFEDRKCRIPAGDPVLRADLHKTKKVVGPTGAPRLMADRDEAGHADRAWAAFLGLAAARSGGQVYDYTPARDPGDLGDDARFKFKPGAW
ncbi:MAG: terminase family protein [Deltaproteobacteria bacterium]|nr:terminase family protein [Deltaproteobacteria bacterium]